MTPFALEIRERARGYCENCLAHGKRVEGVVAHHINPKSVARKPSKWEPQQLPEGLEDYPNMAQNGILLCGRCDLEAHQAIRESRARLYHILARLYPSYGEIYGQDPFCRFL